MQNIHSLNLQANPPYYRVYPICICYRLNYTVFEHGYIDIFVDFGL